MEVPAPLKKSIRQLMLSSLESQTLDHFELGLFEWYVRETEAVMAAMLKTEKEFIQNQVASGVPDINDSGMLAVDYYMKRNRYSHIIYLTSLLECCLARACDTLAHALGRDAVPFNLDELSGNQWDKKRKFLERYGRFELPKELWSELQTLTDLRNVLVHENGQTLKIKDAKLRRLKMQQGIAAEGHEITVDEAYVQHALRAVDDFVKAVEGGVGEVIRRAKRPRPIS